MVVLAVAVALVLSLSASDAGNRADSASAAKPQLRVVDLSPFAVVGTGFKAGETVRVTVRARGGSASTTDDAAASGRVEVRFPRMKLGRCPEYVISARGDKGSRAGLRSIPRPCGIDPRGSQ